MEFVVVVKIGFIEFSVQINPHIFIRYLYSYSAGSYCLYLPPGGSDI
jgi:hypothetical protein